MSEKDEADPEEVFLYLAEHIIGGRRRRAIRDP